MNFYGPSTIDDIAPFGNDLYWDANTFTFSEPVFAVGFTFIATDYPNSDAPGSFDNNVQNISHEVRAYGENGSLIENVFSSSWTIHTGPRHFYIGGGLDFVASYAGIWTDTPIYSVSFGGIRLTDGALMATYGSFSFSRTPLQGPSPVSILIDIKPGSDPNSINLGSKGVVPVAVLTSEDFDASTVDPNTVFFAGVSPVKWTMEDVDGDGDVDLLFHFKTQEMNLTEDNTEATLTGFTYGGQPIKGTDSVKIVPKGKGKEK